MKLRPHLSIRAKILLSLTFVIVVMGTINALLLSQALTVSRQYDAITKASYQMNRDMGAMVASTKQLEAALLKLDGAVGTFGVSLRGLFGS